MEPRLRRHLERVDERFALVGCERAAAVAWTVFAVLALLLFSVRGETGWSPVISSGVLLAVAVAAVLGVRWRTARRRRDPIAVARLVEERFQGLDTSLLAAAELEPDLPEGQYGFLARRLVDEVLRKARNEHWVEEVAGVRLRWARGFHAAGAVLFAASIALLYGSTFVAPPESAAEGTGTARMGEVAVLPGDAEVEAGRSVLVSAEFDAARVPRMAELVYRTDGGEPVRVEMSRSLDDPLFGARLASVTEHISYHVEWDGESTRTYRLTVFQRPELVRADIVLRYPDYTGLEERRIEDTRRITAPEGTEATIICRLNKAVASAIFTEEGTSARTPLAADPENPLERSATFRLTESMRLSLALIDEVGRTNAKPITLVFRVTENERPELSLRVAGDLRASPIEELALRAGLSDDYGVVRFGVGYRIGGEAAVEVVIGGGAERDEKTQAEHTIALEELGAEPAQLISYHFWAEDRDVDGALRRTSSDLFFAEVRPFEEIFRQAEPQPGGEEGGGEGGGGGGGGAAAELVDLQRDVVLATWNLIRRGAQDADVFQEDVDVVIEAQQTVRDRLEELGDGVPLNPLQVVDDTGATILEIARSMDRALLDLGRARTEVLTEPLSDALAGEQAAYQALLELRAEEFAVQRAQAQGGGGGGGGGGPSQAQLGELELDEAQNRYETQSAARPERALDEDAARDTRQALSRLKELARRQSDLNERVRELAAELEAAETEAEREEIQRRLKRLQEAQEEILRDTDELAQRMDESANREQLAEQRDQLERTRENVRRASEALEEGRLSQALTEGSRASRELSELEEELRDAAGGQLEDRMREMQQEARRIEAEEQRLAEALEETDAASRRSLREDTTRGELERALEEQERGIDELLSEAEETVREAETTEPLLAEELFEAVSEARNNRVAEALEMTREMLERGFPAQARAAEREAGEGVRELREGIEDAAESVLGTGAEALERARAELERLSGELESEIARARGESAQASGEPQQGDGEPRTGSGEPAQEGDEPGQGGGDAEPGSDAAAQGGEGGEQPGGEGGEPAPGSGGSGQGVADGEPAPGEQGTSGGRRGAPRSLTGTDPSRPETGAGRGLGGGRYEGAPLTGEDFLDWSDRLRDVEEMIDDPELSAEAARVRSRARTVREDFKRHSKDPDWELVDEKIAVPLAELSRRVADEVLRRRADDRLVPIDRDPVPPEFEEAVRRYYERLGRTR